MKIQAIVLGALIALSGVAASGQRRSEFKKIYGLGAGQYAYRNVTLEPRFNHNGQICRLRLRPDDSDLIRVNADYPRVSGVVAQEILDRIDPDQNRGLRTTNWGIGLFLGQVYVTPYEFETIIVTTSGHIWPKSGSRSVADRENENRDRWDILAVEEGSMFPSAELITFLWKQRACK